MKKFIVAFILLFLISLTYGAIYMQKDANNNISYSDTPSDNAMSIDVPNVSSSISTSNAGNNENKNESSSEAEVPPPQADQPGKLVYTDLRLLSPKDQETFQNQASIPVKLKITPKLQASDTIQLVVDGNLWGNPSTSMEITLTNLPRGTHTISAVLMNDQQKIIITSNMVTIFNHKASVLNKAGG